MRKEAASAASFFVLNRQAIAEANGCAEKK
jgi:hypothetical protein